jgi:nucleotide-binding universal stress UspA family protein
MEIVVGVDGSAPSNRALAWALEDAGLRGGTTVTLVHAYRVTDVGDPYVYPDAYLPSGLAEEFAERRREWYDEQADLSHQQAESLVAGVLEAAGGAPDGVTVKNVLLADEPGKALVDVSRDADLLAVGRRGLGGFKGLLLGSVSQKCLHHAHCPVVLVR